MAKMASAASSCNLPTLGQRTNASFVRLVLAYVRGAIMLSVSFLFFFCCVEDDIV